MRATVDQGNTQLKGDCENIRGTEQQLTYIMHTKKLSLPARAWYRSSGT